MAVNIYSSEELQSIVAGGKINSRVLEMLLAKAVAGISTGELDRLAEKEIISLGGRPSFKTEKGYCHSTCLNVNEVVVHGIPGDYLLKSGDVLGIDLGVFYEGFHTDSSWSIVIDEKNIRREELEKKQKFLAVGEKALKLAVDKCQIGNRIGDVSKQIQTIIEGAGYSVVKQLVGHGVGRKLHEDPEIPGYLRGKIEHTAEIQEGMVLAVEIIYNEGASPIVYGSDDGWTIISRDLSLSGLFEQTVIITKKGPVVVTK